MNGMFVQNRTLSNDGSRRDASQLFPRIILALNGRLLKSSNLWLTNVAPVVQAIVVDVYPIVQRALTAVLARSDVHARVIVLYERFEIAIRVLDGASAMLRTVATGHFLRPNVRHERRRQASARWRG
jgi:hypothetical protein